MKKARPFFFVLFAVLFAFSGIMIIRELHQQKKDIDSFNQLSELITPVEIPSEPPTPPQLLQASNRSLWWKSR